MLDPMVRLHCLEMLAISPLLAFLPLVLLTLLVPFRR
jgi:hypothetical protein